MFKQISLNISLRVLLCFVWVLPFLLPVVSWASEPMTWQRAIDRDDASALQQLMAEADVFETNEKGKTALMSAARLGDLKMLNALIERGLELTDRSKTGGTTLMYAALGNQLEMIRFIRAQVNETGFINSKSVNGWTAIMIASAKGFDKAVKLLVELGADPSLADVYQWSPLMRAIDNRHTKVVSYLLSLDQVNVNATNENGSTALHIAALVSDEVSAAALLRRPDILTGIEDKVGKRAVDIAVEGGNQQLVDLLLNL